MLTRDVLETLAASQFLQYDDETSNILDSLYSYNEQTLFMTNVVQT